MLSPSRSCLTLLVLLVAASPAAAQVEAQIAELNAQALEAYQALDLDAARAKLEQAIGLAQQSGYAGPEVANTYMNLGVVFVAGFNDPDQGLTAFVSGMCIQPDAQLDPLLSTPDVQQVFLQAQQDAAAGACGPTTAPPGSMYPTPSTAPPTVMGNGPQVLDQECPPGVICEPTERDDGPRDFARFFFNVQLAGGFTYVTSGMKADSRPPLREIFIDEGTFVDANNDGMIDGMDIADFDGDGVPDDYNKDGVQDNRFYFDDHSAWVPDADSYDDYIKYREDPNTGMIVLDPMTGMPLVQVPRARTPVPGNCDADGKETGPLDPQVTKPSGGPFTEYLPSSYCVRVKTPGVVSNLALRLNPGYFLSDTFALSLPIRFQFDAGQGSFSNLLVGLRGELLFSTPSATGVPVSWFFGATYGQIQAKPPPKDPSRAAPYVVSGPFGLHTGVNVRIRVHRNFGFIISPELDFQFPDILFNGDLSGGVEAAF